MSFPGIAAIGPTWEARCGRDTLEHSGEGRLLERQGRMIAPPGDRGQLDFLQHVQRIFDEGEDQWAAGLAQGLTRAAIEATM